MRKQKSSILSHDDRKKSQGYIELKKMTEAELNEVIQRQEKLLSNKSFIMKLPDKGGKILAFKAEVESEIDRRRKEFDSACSMMEKLNINSPLPEDIEWNKGGSSETKKELDSDDDSDVDVDPLKLIATHSGTVQTARKKKEIPPEPSLITESDLKEISYEVQVCEKYGNVVPQKERFKPNQLKNNDKDKFIVSAENVKKRLGDKWEVTEATPPVSIYKDTKMISLSESLKLQREQAEKLKEIEKQHATERLLRNTNIKMGDTLPVKNITEYRTPRDIFEETENESEDEARDEEKGGVVFYNLIDDTPEPT
ncbi:UNVERIFIED_CONTAM: hypothetical protein PYX00_003391 [Menopon gallinae]|uniref:Uncharacterized protein n=1 Tax=Menopon gallinae TaxID=328185 RepID=A0AAW2I044_9NEOP